MRVMILIALMLLAGCDTAEKDARRQLTLYQQQFAAGSYVEALETLESLVKKYPETTAATEAMREVVPLRNDRFAAILGCVKFRSDTGRDLDSARDLVERSRMVDGWKGPYVTDEQLARFGGWIAKKGCRDE